MMANSGRFTSAFETGDHAVDRELSCFGLLLFRPQAFVWPWQHGEASIKSCFGTCDQSAWCRSWQICWVSGWLAVCHSTAAGQWLAAQRTCAPASRAPVDHPPRPANKSIAVNMGILAGIVPASTGGRVMSRDWVVWLGCLLLFVCGGLFFRISPVVIFKLELTWEAFSAIGTLGAVVVSLYLARSAERRLRSENKERSSLVAARLWPIAEALNSQLADLSGWVYFDNLDAPESISDIRERVKRLHIYFDRMTMQDIERIIAIDISIANYLSRAMGEVEGVIASVEREGEEWNNISQVSKDFYRERWGNSIISARDFLTMALPSLMYAAQKAAPFPDWHEIYNDEAPFG
ncbi:hypothetical protein FBY06_1445 [Pseudomonas sp. SJZ085]|nr:hypothetical protein FBX99_1445 [Pseudomonas sp. SJZ074]TWC30018.1 hypothetical protein FBY06_1445 [Pseudomonas sp. SJZ085]